MSKLGDDLQRASNGGGIDPFEAPVLAAFSNVEQANLGRHMKDCRTIAYLLGTLAVGASFLKDAQPAIYFFGLVAVVFWAIHRYLLRVVENDERFHLTDTYFLVVSKKKLQSYELSRLVKIVATGPETDEDNDYRVVFDDGREYWLSCAPDSKRLIKALSQAAQVGITSNDRSGKMLSRLP